MKILFCVRKDFNIVKGGDTIQILKTKEMLEKNYDVDIEIIVDPKNMLEKDYDICHIFNIQRIDESLNFFYNAKIMQKKIILSPIYWNLSYGIIMEIMSKLNINFYNKYIIEFLIKGLKIIGKIFGKPVYFSKNYKKKITKILLESDYILPNSDEELKMIADNFNIDLKKLSYKSSIVINAVEFNINNIYDEKIDLKNYILQVGRIEPTKNQAIIIKALMEYPEIPILFIGNQKCNKKYFNYCKRMALKRTNVYFYNEVDQKKLGNYYKKATLHILPSLRESPGLVSLEAIYYGTNIIVSNKKYCPIETYFNKQVDTVDPLSIESVKNTILKNYQKKDLDIKLRENILKKFTWKEASKATYRVYKKLEGDN